MAHDLVGGGVDGVDGAGEAALERALHHHVAPLAARVRRADDRDRARVEERAELLAQVGRGHGVSGMGAARTVCTPHAACGEARAEVL